MKKIILLIMSMLLSLVVLSQSNDELSDAYFMKARHSYIDRDYEKALSMLDKSASYLNSPSADICVLYVKIYNSQENYILSEKYLNKYFEKANSSNHKDYKEMSSLFTDVKDMAEIQRETKKLEIANKELKKEIDEEEKLEVESKIRNINRYISENNLQEAFYLYNKVKSSEFYSDYKINNIESLKCYIEYKKAEKTNTVYAYDSYIKTNTNCLNIKDAKNKLETLTIQEGDKLYKQLYPNGKKDIEVNYEDKEDIKRVKLLIKKAKEYYNIYIYNFPYGENVDIVKLKVLTLEKKQKVITLIEQYKYSKKSNSETQAAALMGATLLRAEYMSQIKEKSEEQKQQKNNSRTAASALSLSTPDRENETRGQRESSNTVKALSFGESEQSKETGVLEADDIHISSLLSPNSSELPNYWEIKGLEKYPNNSVTIMDRLKKIVYTSSPYKNNFKGISTNGEELLEGTYYYKINLGNNYKEKTGFIFIQR